MPSPHRHAFRQRTTKMQHSNRRRSPPVAILADQLPAERRLRYRRRHRADAPQLFQKLGLARLDGLFERTAHGFFQRYAMLLGALLPAFDDLVLPPADEGLAHFY